MSTVEGNNFFNFFFFEKWKTNRKQTRRIYKTNGAWTSPSILVLTCWVWRGRGTEHVT